MVDKTRESSLNEIIRETKRFDQSKQSHDMKIVSLKQTAKKAKITAKELQQKIDELAADNSRLNSEVVQKNLEAQEGI